MNNVNSIVALLIIGSVIWVGVDASNHGVHRGGLGGGFLDMGVASWVICCLIFWIVALPCYLVARGRYRNLRAAGYQRGPVYNAGPPGYNPNPYAAANPYPAAAPPQASPDGQWWWTGQQWVPVQAPAMPGPPPAF